MKTVKFAIVGCGVIGSRHAARMEKAEGTKLAGVCDIIEEKAKKLGETYNCPFYTNIEDLLRESDADYVNICTPSGLHAKHSIQSLNAGKNVLCEKPMALKESDAVLMVETAKRNGRLLYSVKQNRYNPPVKLAWDLARKGVLGKPLLSVVNVYWNRNDAYYRSADWRGTIDMERSTIFSQASHFADLFLMFMGRPKKIFSMMENKTHDIEIDDTGVVSVLFENGAFGNLNYTMSAAKKNIEGSITLFYEKGTIKIGGEYLNNIDFFDVVGMDSYTLDGPPAEANDYGSYRGSSSNHHLVFRAIVEKENGEDNDSTSRLVTGEETIPLIRFFEKSVIAAEEKKIIDF